VANCKRPAQSAPHSSNQEAIVLIYPSEVYKNETYIVAIFPDWNLLPYVRMGVVTSQEIGTTSAGPYRLVVAYAAGKRRGPFHSSHRIAYLNVAGAPDHIDGIDPDYDSDNLLLPSSFIAQQALSIEPNEFGLSDGGPDGTLKVKWGNLINERKRAADRHCYRLGIAPLNSSVERWGQTYTEEL
jgi:hypothetical protein